MDTETDIRGSVFQDSDVCFCFLPFFLSLDFLLCLALFCSAIHAIGTVQVLRWNYDPSGNKFSPFFAPPPGCSNGRAKKGKYHSKTPEVSFQCRAIFIFIFVECSGNISLPYAERQLVCDFVPHFRQRNAFVRNASSRSRVRALAPRR